MTLYTHIISISHDPSVLCSISQLQLDLRAATNIWSGTHLDNKSISLLKVSGEIIVQCDWFTYMYIIDDPVSLIIIKSMAHRNESYLNTEISGLR